MSDTHDHEHDHRHESPIGPDGWLIPEDGREYLKEVFQNLVEPVRLVVFTHPGEDDPYKEYMTAFAADLAKLSDKIDAEYYEVGGKGAGEFGVEAPAMLISPDKYHLRFLGAPLGEEARSFIEAVLLASLGRSGLTPQSKKVLEGLDEERFVQVFVSPSCPYCPGQVANAFRAAIERPGLVKAEAVVTTENPDLARKYNVGSVPHTIINDREHEALGLMPEERFVRELVELKDVEDAAMGAPGGPAEGPGVVELDLVVAGAGPAGLTAGIYAERSGLSTVILEKGIIGGQVTLTPVVENYPGFANVAGKKLMEIMSLHAREYCTINEGEEVHEVKVGRNIEVLTNRNHYVAKALILATGVSNRRLGVPGEDRYFGMGVNYCATCDGYLYKGRKVAVAGGGNTALTDALHLKNLGVDVTLIHRRDAFRAEKHLQDSVEREGIPVLWNTVVREIRGDESRVSSLLLENTQDGHQTEFDTDGLFVAVGHIAHNEIASQIGLTLDEAGFVKVDHGMRTNIPRIYAAGDLTGGVRQIVTAVGEGSTAALSAFEDVAHPYWKK